MGLFLQIVLAALINAGQIVAGGMGLSIAMSRPKHGEHTYAFAIFLITGFAIHESWRYLILISMVSTSLKHHPVITTGALSIGFYRGFISWSAHMFLGAIAIAFPIIFGLLLVNASLGIVSRAAPSLNVFAVGFPALIPAGLIMLLLTMAIWFEQVENLWF